MMKVALLHYDFKPYAVSLANGLAEHVELTVIHPEKLSPDCDDALDKRIQIHNFNKPRARSISNLKVIRHLFQSIRDLKPDVLHVQSTCDPWFDTALLYDKLPPMVTTIHDLFPHPGDQARVWGSNYTGRIPYYRSQHLIVHTQLQKDQLRSYFKRQHEQVSVLELGELSAFYRHWSNHQAVDREPYSLLFFGRIWPYKGLRYLVEAMPMVAEHFPQVKLVIAGRGEDLNSYFPNGVDANRFEIVDQFIPNAAAASYFQRSTVTVLPYIEASQSGVAAVAYGFGTPVVASRVGGLGELIRDGEDGLLVEPGDPRALAGAIIKLLGDPDLQRRMRAAAALRCQDDLNWSNIALKTINIYQKAMQTTRQRQ